MPNEIPLSRRQWLKDRDHDRLAAQVDGLKAENERLRTELEACAENLELQLSRHSMPCESASPKADADSFGGYRALADARAALEGKEVPA